MAFVMSQKCTVTIGAGCKSAIWVRCCTNQWCLFEFNQVLVIGVDWDYPCCHLIGTKLRLPEARE